MSLSVFAGMPVEEQEARGLLHTSREIAQQPATWKATFNLFRAQQEELCRFLEAAGVRGELTERPTVWLIGAGTSDYIGKSFALLLREKWGCEVVAIASTDLLPNLETYVVPGRRYLWISFSRSGDSPEGVAVLERAVQRYPEIAQLVVTCNEAGAMASIARRIPDSAVVVLGDEVNDRSLVMTSSFTNMVVLGHCLAHAWSLSEYQEILESLITAGEEFLSYATQVAQSAADQDFRRVCYLGSGPSAGVAQEAALKVLEMTAGEVKSGFETILGLRHGPMAALDQNTLVVCFLSTNAARAGYAYDLLQEIHEKQLVRSCFAIGPASLGERFHGVTDRYLDVQTDCDDSYRSVVDIIFGQLFGFFCSVRHELKPDAPSAAGVINRVVAKFAIY